MERAMDIFSNALAEAKEFSFDDLTSSFLHNLGILKGHFGMRLDQEDLYYQSLEIRKRLGDKQGISMSLSSLGLLYKNQGKIEEAEQLYLESLEIKRQLGDKKGISSSLSNLGVIYFELGQDQKALEHLIQSIDLKKELNEIPGIIATVHRAFSLFQQEEQEKRLLEVKGLDSKSFSAKENCWLLNIELMHCCLNLSSIDSQEILNGCHAILELSAQTNLTDIDDLPVESFYWATQKLIAMNQVEEAKILAKQALHWIGVRNTRRKAAFEKITAK